MHAEQPSEQLVPESSGAASAPQAIAIVDGRALCEMPRDLYIPPDALEIFLDAFEGPLDLLLYLIKRQNLDILNIPISDVTAQYMQYIGLMESMRFELAAEYLLMAAMLAEIKSRMLLPRVDEQGDEEDDPRAELIRRLQDYERIKEAAAELDGLPRLERDHHVLQVTAPAIDRELPPPQVSLAELLLALKAVVDRAALLEHHHVDREVLSVRARMSQVLAAMRPGECLEFARCLAAEEGRMGVVVTFLAVLELCKESLIDIVQSQPFAPIYLAARADAVDPAGVRATTHGQTPEEPAMMGAPP